MNDDDDDDGFGGVVVPHASTVLRSRINPIAGRTEFLYELQTF